VLSAIDAADAGGWALDQILAGQLPALVQAADPSAAPGLGGVAVWAARGARESLSGAAAVAVALPAGHRWW